MTVSGSWVEAVVAAGAVPASHVPDASLGRGDLEEFTGADPIEDPELRVHALEDARPLAPAAVCFLDGIEQWRVVGYGGITPIVRAHAAAAIRRRGPDRRLRTVAEATEEVAITRLDRLPAGVRRALEAADVRVLEFPAEHSGPPARAWRPRGSRCRRSGPPSSGAWRSNGSPPWPRTSGWCWTACSRIPPRCPSIRARSAS